MKRDELEEDDIGTGEDRPVARRRHSLAESGLHWRAATAAIISHRRGSAVTAEEVAKKAAAAARESSSTGVASV
eukprot:5575235-Prymnesium_polylepis.1